MREILGRRRMTRPTLRDAALTCATRWQWPVLPGATLTTAPSGGADRRPEPRPGADTSAVPGTSAAPAAPFLPGAATPSAPDAVACSCADPECAVPGAHPLDPALLAATTDGRMVGWWWTERPDASLILATGTPAAGRRSPCALSLPARAGARALADFDRLGLRLGPVVASPTRYALLVAPYELEELGDLLYAQDWVPSSLRFHGEGGYVALPPTAAAGGGLSWERGPVADGDGEGPWLPRMETLISTLVEASTATPDPGSRLAY